MAGLYIHIPFCKQACSYCNFHFSTRLGQMEQMVDALIGELELRADYLGDEQLESVYFGGGTPSLLSSFQLEKIWQVVESHFRVCEGMEITLEANPDDLTREKLVELKAGPVNRLSIGIQSFSDVDLRFMHRVHDTRQAVSCIEEAFRVGLNNLSVDLIYGTPGMPDEVWNDNLLKVDSYGIPHLSCYALTVESKTLLAHQIRHHQASAPVEEVMTRQFYQLVNFAAERGYDHYEISNFARSGHLAVHNTNYWKQKSYLGVGPSAHSYDGATRSWNIANNNRYMQAISQGNLPMTVEFLTIDQHYNEYVMTGLRTQWGCRETELKRLGQQYFLDFQKGVQTFIECGWITVKEGSYRLTNDGKLFADFIASELFAV